MCPLLRTRQVYPTLAQNGRELADCLLHNAEQARAILVRKSRPVSSQKPSSDGRQPVECGVRFAQKMGYRGFPALKLAQPAVTIHNQILSSDALKPLVKIRVESRRRRCAEYQQRRSVASGAVYAAAIRPHRSAVHDAVQHDLDHTRGHSKKLKKKRV